MLAALIPSSLSIIMSDYRVVSSDRQRQQKYKSDWLINFDDDDLVQPLSFDLDVDTYPYLMNLFINAIGIDREFGFARIKVHASEKAPERDMSIVVKKRRIYVVAIHKGKLLNEQMLGSRGSLIGLQVSRRLFHEALLAIINYEDLSWWKKGAGMFAFVVCEAGRFSCIYKALRIVFCLDTSITLTNSYEWMANIPKLWWKFSKWDREIAKCVSRTVEETPAEDITNKAAKLLKEADAQGASRQVKRWGRDILKFASWDKNRSSILPNRSNLAKFRKERGQLKLETVKRSSTYGQRIEPELWGQIKFLDEKETTVKTSSTSSTYRQRIEPSLELKNNLGKNSIDFLVKVDKKNHPMLYLRKGTMIMNQSCGIFRDPSPSLDMSALSGKIITCSWDYNKNSWTLHHVPNIGEYFIFFKHFDNFILVKARSFCYFLHRGFLHGLVLIMRSIEDKGILNLGSTQEIQGGGNGSNRGSHHHRTALGKPTPSKWDNLSSGPQDAKACHLLANAAMPCALWDIFAAAFNQRITPATCAIEETLSEIKNYAVSEIKKLSGSANGEAGYKDGDLGSALFNKPKSFAIDRKNNIYIADKSNQICANFASFVEGSKTTSSGELWDMKH
ncbi:putative NHL domain-containing protein [Tanacetum coccineum]